MADPTIIILMGVSGAGKTLIGQRLATQLGWTFCDADEFHPPENIAKMQQGIPLQDCDRIPWLAILNQEIAQWLETQQRTILACSALKASYRQQLYLYHPQVQLVYLHGYTALIKQRLQERRGHFMRSELLQSQLDSLEEPTHGIRVNVDQEPDAILSEIINTVFASDRYRNRLNPQQWP